MTQEEEFNALIKANHSSIYRICRAYLYDVSHANDLYQEILFQIWKSIQSFKGNSRVSTWVYRVAVNTAINYNLKYKKHAHESLPDLADQPYEDTLTAKIEQDAQLDKLRYCISKLEDQNRLIISLVLENRSYKDIAEITGTNINLVGVKINRIKASLLKLMQSNS
ncbi:MAG: sigma-70 family RNA polymerase sigma factor [Pedobacter sp.]|nr:MAG: sigma-70 family RNA polymerase sigma factor [Pedobacter sp.]